MVRAGATADPHLLITDDNADFRNCLCEGLQRHGYRTSVASDGLEALAMLQQVPVDVLIADIHMPRLDGIQMLAAVRELPRQPPCILMSAELDEYLVSRATALKAESVLAKPFRLATIAAAVRQILASRGL